MELVGKKQKRGENVLKITLITLSILICFANGSFANESSEVSGYPNGGTAVTEKDYLELAEVYKDYAAYYREETGMHRKMKKDARMWSDGKSGAEQFIIEHCDAIIADLESLASKMDLFSEWYGKKAKEKSDEKGNA